MAQTGERTFRGKATSEKEVGLGTTLVPVWPPEAALLTETLSLLALPEQCEPVGTPGSGPAGSLT